MRGILMIEPLYHQTVAGLKTQTRRSGGLEQVNGREAVIKKGMVVKPAIVTDPDYWMIDKYGNLLDDNKHRSVVLKSKIGKGMVTCKPRYHVGEVLYIKEPISLGPLHRLYQYSLPVEERKNYEWSNKLFMRADAARAYVRITGIKCERLLDISDDDCLAEGIERPVPYNRSIWHYKDYHIKKGQDDFDGFVLQNLIEGARRSFISLYEVANKIKQFTWPKENPWVWVYSFEYLKDYGL